jgi:hypothetical protein
MLWKLCRVLRGYHLDDYEVFLLELGHAPTTAYMKGESLLAIRLLPEEDHQGSQC